MTALALAPPAADTADDLSRYLRPRAGGGATFEIAVKGARCAGCIAKIENGVREMAGVRAARLNLSTGKLAVELGPAASPHAILGRIRALGYEAQPFDAGEALDAGAAEGRFLLRCLAVAGFGTAFTVGLTDAVWYGGEDMAEGLRAAFFWLAGMVAVPATLYAGQPFFRSALRALAKGHANMDVPISLALFLSLGLSAWQTARHGANVYFDAAAMLAFLLLAGRTLDFRLRDHARGAARRLLAMQALLARRLDARGEIETVPARDLMPGERILLASGDRAPVNGVLETPTELDVSLVTGESLPARPGAGAAVEAGAVVTGPAVVVRVTARAEDSLVADLARLLEAGQQSRSRYVSLADRAARAYVPLVGVLALAVFGGWMAAGASLETALTDAIAVLVITCPCALGLAVPAVQVAATSRLLRRGVLMKSGDALERLAGVDYALFDKTGTLTLGAPVLKDADSVPPRLLAAAARLARASRHPLARALAAAAGPGPVADHVREMPGMGLEAPDESGARLDNAARQDSAARLGSAAWCGAPHDAPDGGSELWFRAGDAPPLRFVFEDRVRPETRAMIAGLEARGVTVEMLTGDRAGPAATIAAEAGIARWRAGVTPGQKVERLRALTAQGRRVLMVGDGLNDAAALAMAHVSIAPGTAADVSQLAADMVLQGGSLAPLAEALDVARKARRLAIGNFALSLLYNLTAIPLAAAGLVTPLVAAATMAGSSLLVTLNALRLAVDGRGDGRGSETP